MHFLSSASPLEVLVFDPSIIQVDGPGMKEVPVNQLTHIVCYFAQDGHNDLDAVITGNFRFQTKSTKFSLPFQHEIIP